MKLIKIIAMGILLIAVVIFLLGFLTGASFQVILFGVVLDSLLFSMLVLALKGGEEEE